jgi:hypothetical protein
MSLGYSQIINLYSGGVQSSILEKFNLNSQVRQSISHFNVQDLPALKDYQPNPDTTDQKEKVKNALVRGSDR